MKQAPNIPNRPATIIFRTIDIEIIKRENNIIKPKCCTITAVIIANIIPFKIPIENSLTTIVLKVILKLIHSLLLLLLLQPTFAFLHFHPLMQQYLKR